MRSAPPPPHPDASDGVSFLSDAFGSSHDQKQHDDLLSAMGGHPPVLSVLPEELMAVGARCVSPLWLMCIGQVPPFLGRW
jgi:hypothetical protein